MMKKSTKIMELTFIMTTETMLEIQKKEKLFLHAKMTYAGLLKNHVLLISFTNFRKIHPGLKIMSKISLIVLAKTDLVF